MSSEFLESGEVGFVDFHLFDQLGNAGYKANVLDNLIKEVIKNRKNKNSK